MLGDVSADENSCIDMFERVEEEFDRLLEEFSTSKKEKEKLRKMLLGKEVAMNAITLSVRNLEWTVNPLETEKTLLMKTEEEPVSCSLQMTTSSGRTMVK